MPLYVYFIIKDVEGLSGPVVTRYPQQFSTREVAQEFINNRKAMPAYEGIAFEISEEDPAADAARSKAFEDA